MRKQILEHLAQHKGDGLNPVALAAVQTLAAETATVAQTSR